MTKVDKHIANELKRRRRKADLTPSEMAKLMGFKSHVSILRMEQGKQSFSSTNIWMLCSIFHVTPNDLMPPIKHTEITKQKREVFIQPKMFKVKRPHYFKNIQIK